MRFVLHSVLILFSFLYFNLANATTLRLMKCPDARSQNMCNEKCFYINDIEIIADSSQNIVKQKDTLGDQLLNIYQFNDCNVFDQNTWQCVKHWGSYDIHYSSLNGLYKRTVLLFNKLPFEEDSYYCAKG